MDNLIDLFKKFPGIGARQAKRFVSFIMHASPSYRKELMAALNNTHENVQTCTECHKRYIKNGNTAAICLTCKKEGRDNSLSQNSEPEEKSAPIPNEHNIGRNDPCWCNSGKKYKKCHGK